MKTFTREELGIIYESVVGYNIADDSNLSADEILKIMREYDKENPNKPFSKLILQ